MITEISKITVQLIGYPVTAHSSASMKISQAAFAMTCFWGLSDVHECSDGLQMAPSPLDNHTAGCNSPHDWLMSLAMDAVNNGYTFYTQ